MAITKRTDLLVTFGPRYPMSSLLMLVLHLPACVGDESAALSVLLGPSIIKQNKI
jgi:hypothetical protein